ncbi:Crp/Fnr family transcriptional regulator [Deinococcus sp.]|uniref:Crp/Fnr family transcriptional regulator n=1 Tax=Deinococcus sp. TaxID=47478 RepID=UPI003CC56D1D
MVAPAALLSSPLFLEVPPEAAALLLTGATELYYRPGETLMHQETQGQALYLLLEGVVRVSRQSLGGRVRVLGDLYAPAVIGETALLVSRYRSASVTALRDVQALVVYREHLERVVNRYPRVAWNLARLLAERVTQLNDELIAAGISTEASLVQVLLQMYGARLRAEVADPHLLPLSLSDLAQRLSSSRETVSRLLKRLSVLGLAHLCPERGVVKLQDSAGLEALLEHLASD